MSCAVLQNMAVFYGVQVPRVSQELERLIANSIFQAAIPHLPANVQPFSRRGNRRQQLVQYFNARLMNAINNNP